MDIGKQTEPGEQQIDLSRATVNDLLRELKSRFVVCGFVGVVDDDDGVERILNWAQGGRVTLLGMIEDLKADLLAKGRAG